MVPPFLWVVQLREAQNCSILPPSTTLITDTMPTKQAEKLAAQIAEMLTMIGELEGRLADLKRLAKGKRRRATAAGAAATVGQAQEGGAAAAAAAQAKPTRPPTAWTLFCTRVSSTLKTAGTPLGKETFQFCKHLKDSRTMDEWTDETILAARAEWSGPPTPVHSVGPTDADADAEEDEASAAACPTCGDAIADRPEQHRACLLAVAEAAAAAGQDPFQAVDAWSEAVHAAPARPVALPPIFEGRAVRRPSAPLQCMAPVVAAVVPPFAPPSEDMVIDDC